MTAMTRGWAVWMIALGAVGLLFILMGFGVDMGRWWPLVFTLFGVASLTRGIVYRENTVLGLLLIGWGLIGVAATHGGTLGIVSVLPFLFGALVVWAPLAVLLARVIRPESK